MVASIRAESNGSRSAPCRNRGPRAVGRSMRPPISWGPMLLAELCPTGTQKVLLGEIPAQLGRNLEPESRYLTVLIYLR
jgi:hypothetical protein